MTSTQTPIEKARELAHCDTCNTCDNSNCFSLSEFCLKKIELSVAMQMHEWDKKQFIKKTCEWLEGVRLDYYSENIKEFIENFKKYAEEQL